MLDDFLSLSNYTSNEYFSMKQCVICISCNIEYDTITPFIGKLNTVINV